MAAAPPKAGRLLAISDLHVRHPENRRIVEELRPRSRDSWLIVAGDVGAQVEDVEWALSRLRDRFAVVVWTPGNHELWTPPADPVDLRGEQRYDHLVGLCRRLGVLTPEDPYPIWEGEGGPAAVVPLFVLYDYTFRPAGAGSQEEALRQAYEAGVVCTDERLLHPDPYPSREAWCHARIAACEHRLGELEPALPTVLVNHFPLVREPTRILRHPEFAQWCGSERTADWHRRYRAAAVVYGHLHIPRTSWADGVPFREVSLGYPREWRGRPVEATRPRQILPTQPPGG
jgi:3',5'-cyclic AMP phosphodiesterase CpdA